MRDTLALHTKPKLERRAQKATLPGKRNILVSMGSTTPGSKAFLLPTSATRAFVLRGMRVFVRQILSDGIASWTCSLPLVNLMAPPKHATALSIPDGLPWMTFSARNPKSLMCSAS